MRAVANYRMRAVNSAPVATIRGYRRRDGAVVTVERPGGSAHRYRVSLRRYAALQKWAAGPERGTTSGAWSRAGFAVTFWKSAAATQEVHRTI